MRKTERKFNYEMGDGTLEKTKGSGRDFKLNKNQLKCKKWGGLWWE